MIWFLHFLCHQTWQQAPFFILWDIFIAWQPVYVMVNMIVRMAVELVIKCDYLQFNTTWKGTLNYIFLIRWSEPNRYSERNAVDAGEHFNVKAPPFLQGFPWLVFYVAKQICYALKWGIKCFCSLIVDDQWVPLFPPFYFSTLLSLIIFPWSMICHMRAIT